MNIQKQMFDQIEGFIRDDFKKCLEIKEVGAGLLLSRLLTAVEMLSGCVYGFYKTSPSGEYLLNKKGKNIGNSKKRFIDFLQEKMKFKKDFSELFYQLIRCDFVHGGLQQSGIFIGIRRPPKDDENYFMVSEEKVYINVDALAYKVLKVIPEIKSNLRYMPDLKEEDYNAFKTIIIKKQYS